jgi:hypothetical protein
MRAKVKEVMRYAGSRMIYRHPYLALRHILDGLRRGEKRPKRKSGDRGAL